MVTLNELMLRALLLLVVVFALAWPVARGERLKRGLALFEDVFSGVFLSTGLAVVLISVFMRYVLNDPPGWADEFARVFVAWGAMFGFSLALRERRHITVDMLHAALPPGGKRFLDLLAHLLGAIFSAFLAVTGWAFIMFQKMLDLRSIYTDIPEWILMFILPLGFFLFGLRFAVNFYDLWRGEVQEPEEVPGV